MPIQGQSATSPVDTGDGHSLYAPNGAVIESGNGRPEPAAVPLPDPLPDPLPPDVPTPNPRPLDAMSQSIHFWQGLAVGLGAAIVILFLLAAVLAG